MTRRFPPTSMYDRSPHARRAFHCEFALPLVCDPQYLWRSQTTWGRVPFHQAAAYTETGTSEIGCLYPASAFQSQMELGVISHRFVRLELSPRRPDEDLL